MKMAIMRGCGWNSWIILSCVTDFCHLPTALQHHMCEHISLLLLQAIFHPPTLPPCTCFLQTCEHTFTSCDDIPQAEDYRAYTVGLLKMEHLSWTNTNLSWLHTNSPSALSETKQVTRGWDTFNCEIYITWNFIKVNHMKRLPIGEYIITNRVSYILSSALK